MTKKEILNVLNKNVRNSFGADEAGQKAAESIIELVSALVNDEEEHNLEELERKVNELLAAAKEAPAVSEPVAEFVHNSIEARMKVLNGIAKAPVSKEVKNGVAKMIVEYKGDNLAKLRADVDAFAVKNGVTGLTFNDVIDYTLVDKFGKEDALYSQFTQTKVSRFFYSENSMATAAAIAKQWDKSSSVAKDIQTLTVTPKTITTAYVYKRQQVANEDLDEIDRAGDEVGFLNYITEELGRVLVNTIVMAILTGDAVNASGKKVTTFETIAKASTDAFTMVTTAAATVPTVTEVRTQADLIYNPNGLKKVAIMSAATKTSLAGYVYASGGDTYYRSDAELAGQLGVDEIYTTDLMNAKGVIVMLPAEYHILDKRDIEVAYPTWEHNVNNWQVEKNIGGKIHGLLSTAYIKPHA